MGGLTGGLTGGLEKHNPLIIRYLVKIRGGLGKNDIIHINMAILSFLTSRLSRYLVGELRLNLYSLT